MLQQMIKWHMADIMTITGFKNCESALRFLDAYWAQGQTHINWIKFAREWMRCGGGEDVVRARVSLLCYTGPIDRPSTETYKRIIKVSSTTPITVTKSISTMTCAPLKDCAGRGHRDR